MMRVEVNVAGCVVNFGASMLPSPAPHQQEAVKYTERYNSSVYTNKRFSDTKVGL